MQILALVNLLAIALPFVSAAATGRHVKRDCDALAFDNGSTSGGSIFVQKNLTGLAEPGQTIAATIVELETCEPYTDRTILLESLFGQAFDLDYTGEAPPGAPVNVPDSTEMVFNGANTVWFKAAVPNGSQHLRLRVYAYFIPGTAANLDFVLQKLGVVYTAA
ncbi:hypothetical protein BKA62DRAFT_756759 [Auriculariales sp. MPI-PUGE-AT-0066]|nr:hypothetical protein BKA62DRAFT_756759 [Auriculariales sp. MPI-PUGE-AT-0066]